MSDAVAPTDSAMDTADAGHVVEKPVSSPGKGKGKAKQDPNAMEEDEEEEEDDDDGEEAEDVEEEDDEDMEEDQPEFLDRRSRRTRAQVDYTSEEALKKAGITKKELDDDDDDEDFHAKPTEDDD
ncbi:hypothetical protein FRC01_004422 [Tulasnella sp. 417]|nr:hypothetical protein FRC01_004422 [Tulasnella sp. 417]